MLTIEIITDNRLDIESVQTTKLPQKVSEIKIKDNSGLVVKNIIFDYEYVGLVSNYCSCRLFLKRVTDKAGEERHVYEFTYDRASSFRIKIQMPLMIGDIIMVRLFRIDVGVPNSSKEGNLILLMCLLIV